MSTMLYSSHSVGKFLIQSTYWMWNPPQETTNKQYNKACVTSKTQISVGDIFKFPNIV